jgi:hypothetical protein
MIFPKGAIKYHCERSNTTTESIWEVLNSSTEIDEIGAMEQILFTFPLSGRTIYKGITQSYTPIQLAACPLSGAWSSGIGQILGDGSVSIEDFFEILESVRAEVFSATDANVQVLLPLTGGLDSRFIADCIAHSNNIDSFTFHAGPSTEVMVAKKIAALHGINHQSVALDPSIYTSAEIFLKHLGMLQHYHAALINISNSLRREHPYQRLLMPHGFMGDPVFGSKATTANKKSIDQDCEDYLNKALKRYPFFAHCISKTIKNEILEDLAKDYIFYAAKDSNATFDEILFITRRQQMIYKIVDLVNDIVPVLTPYASSQLLINAALRLPQIFRISRNAFSDYLLKNSLVSPKINSENPWGLSEVLANNIRRTFNYSQYLLELFNSEIKISPFQHEQLRASVFSNYSYVEDSIKFFEDSLQIDTGWACSLSRRFNTTDFAYSCSSIGHAYSLIKSKSA